MNPEAAAARIAEAQHGMVTWAQLRAAGVSRRAIAAHTANGWIVRRHSGVYQLGCSRDRSGSSTPHCWPAGPDRSSPAGPALRGRARARRPVLVDVGFPSGLAGRRPGDARAPPARARRVRRRGQARAAGHDARADAARSGGGRATRTSSNGSSRRRRCRTLASTGELLAMAERGAGRPGVRMFRELVDLLDEPLFTRSEAERQLAALCRVGGAAAAAHEHAPGRVGGRRGVGCAATGGRGRRPQVPPTGAEVRARPAQGRRADARGLPGAADHLAATDARARAGDRAHRRRAPTMTSRSGPAAGHERDVGAASPRRADQAPQRGLGGTSASLARAEARWRVTSNGARKSASAISRSATPSRERARARRSAQVRTSSSGGAGLGAEGRERGAGAGGDRRRRRRRGRGSGRGAGRRRRARPRRERTAPSRARAAPASPRAPRLPRAAARDRRSPRTAPAATAPPCPERRPPARPPARPRPAPALPHVSRCREPAPAPSSDRQRCPSGLTQPSIRRRASGAAAATSSQRPAATSSSSRALRK